MIILFVGMLTALFFANLAVFHLPERRLRATSKLQRDAVNDRSKTA